MELVNEHLDELVNLIIRPPRHTYLEWELGSKIFSLEDGSICKRVDFQVKNKRNQLIQCSQYYLLKHRKKMPVVIYCHGNSGCRLDAQEALSHLLSIELSVVCFDFSGSGNSEGEYVSLGYFEQDDLVPVVEYLRKNDQTTRIGLWGRSMGAATSLMFGVTDPSVACMVLDSSFSSLKVLANELVTKSEMKIPKMVVSMAFKILKKSIEKKAAFDIEKLEPIKSAPNCFIPALFAHGNEDDFIDPSHSKSLSACYAGDFNLITFEGDHGSMRPGFFYDSVCIFFSNNLLVSTDFGEDNPYVEEKLTEDELQSETHGSRRGRKVRNNEDIERAKQLSLEDAYRSPTSAQEEEELLALALKMSMEEEKKPEKEQNEGQDNKGPSSHKKEYSSKEEKEQGGPPPLPFLPRGHKREEKTEMGDTGVSSEKKEANTTTTTTTTTKQTSHKQSSDDVKVVALEEGLPDEEDKEKKKESDKKTSSKKKK